jgi:hypothetical protein
MKYPIAVQQNWSLAFAVVRRNRRNKDTNGYRPTYRFSDMTAPSLTQAVASNPIISLPLGSYGPYSRMGNYLLADTLAERISEAATARGIKTSVHFVGLLGATEYFSSNPGGLAVFTQS